MRPFIGATLLFIAINVVALMLRPVPPSPAPLPSLGIVPDYYLVYKSIDGKPFHLYKIVHTFPVIETITSNAEYSMCIATKDTISACSTEVRAR